MKADSVKDVEGYDIDEITGYLPEFIPPISVYGVTVLLDKEVAEAEKLRCLVSGEKTLEIVPQEIKEGNEELIIAEITV